MQIYRDLDMGEVIARGDEYWSKSDRLWFPCVGSIGGRFDGTLRMRRLISNEETIAHLRLLDGLNLDAHRELQAENVRLREALREHQSHNGLGNDREAYLFELADWALGERDDRPNPADFGMKPIGGDADG